MRLFITIEIQTGANNLESILNNIIQELDFITNRNKNLEEVDNYGTEFKCIGIIPTCVSKEMLENIGWKERKLIKRKAKETDIRLFMDYERFVKETYENQKLMSIKVLMDSIDVIIEKSKGDFRGKELKRDILNALNVTQEQLDRL